MVGKKVLWAAVVFVMLSATILVVHSDSVFLLNPAGTVRVGLQSIQAGTATWNSIAPHVYDGSFSAMLSTGPATGDGGGVFIGPLSFPLADLTASGITFWAYFMNDQSFHPQVNIVLDNGRVLQGRDSTPVSNSITIKCETGTGCQGYPSSDLWVQLMPTDAFFFSSSFSADPDFGSTPASGCTATAPCPLATWKTVFPTSNVIQIQIVWVRGGQQGSTPFFATSPTQLTIHPILSPTDDTSPTQSDAPAQIIFIDDVTITTTNFSQIIPIEPETTSSADH